jgi:hypothetical protein
MLQEIVKHVGARLRRKHAHPPEVIDAATNMVARAHLGDEEARRHMNRIGRRSLGMRRLFDSAHREIMMYGRRPRHPAHQAPPMHAMGPMGHYDTYAPHEREGRYLAVTSGMPLEREGHYLAVTGQEVAGFGGGLFAHPGFGGGYHPGFGGRGYHPGFGGGYHPGFGGRGYGGHGYHPGFGGGYHPGFGGFPHPGGFGAPPMMGPPGMGGGLPPGSYQASCSNCQMQGNTLSCSCNDKGGSPQQTSLQIDPMLVAQGISNHNGQLVYAAT